MLKEGKELDKKRSAAPVILLITAVCVIMAFIDEIGRAHV